MDVYLDKNIILRSISIAIHSDEGAQAGFYPSPKAELPLSTFVGKSFEFDGVFESQEIIRIC